jgi:ABC-type bacteriocin/lantibiotic exporter with double-glycine peptidase domain
MNIRSKVISSLSKIIKEDKNNVFYLLYYSVIEAILVLSIPLASSFIINSVMAHASISIVVLEIIIIVIFIITTILQIIKEYIIENFQQKVFVNSAIKIAEMATLLVDTETKNKHFVDKYMNYFFDITSIQKFFPILLLDGTGLVVKILVSLLLLFAFSPILFGLGFFFLLFFIVILILLGKNGFQYAVDRSDAKHNAIYYLQTIPHIKETRYEILKNFDAHLNKFISAREKIFKIILRQLSLTFFIEGLIFSSFMIMGGYLVTQGSLPIGEFVAAEIILVSITHTLKGFMKQIDYIYDMVEGFYKVEVLSKSLGEE